MKLYERYFQIILLFLSFQGKRVQSCHENLTFVIYLLSFCMMICLQV